MRGGSLREAATVAISLETVCVLDLGGRYMGGGRLREVVSLRMYLHLLEWTAVLVKTRATLTLAFFLVLNLEEIHKRTYQQRTPAPN